MHNGVHRRELRHQQTTAERLRRGVGHDRREPLLLHPALLVFDHRRTAQKITFMGELFPADWEADERGKTYLEFFQADQENKPKGIIAIDLRLLP